jgi:hypothetical protein
VTDNTGAVDLASLAKDEQDAVERLAAERGDDPHAPDGSDANAPKKVLTAFLVIVGLDGNPEPMAFNDPSLEVIAPPTPDLIYGAAHTLIKDLTAQETAQGAAHATAQLMMQQARAMAEQQQAQAIAQQVNQSGLGRIRG